jgi:hypothetical protein
MKETPKKLGNGAAVRVRRSPYRLEDLVQAINAKNLPEPVDFGPPAGREVW